MTAERRFPIAFGASLLVNALVWTAVGSAFAYRVAVPPTPIEFQRVIIDKRGKKTVKIVKPEEVKRRVQKIVRQQHPVAPRKPTETKPAAHTPVPQGAHQKLLTAPTPTPGTKPPDFTALAGGNAPVGKPTEAQAPGNAVTNPPVPPKVEPPPVTAPPTDPPKVAPPPTPPAAKEEPPKADPPLVPPKVEPKKKGASRDAQHSNEVNPTIPDDVKTQEFKKFVRVRIDISADGSFTVTLRTSSGNEEVDKRVVDALKKWTWKPKLVEGEAVDSTQLFRFDFEIK